MLDGLLAPTHLIVLGLVVMLLFGPKRLPEMGRALGSGIREFKDSITGQPPNAPAETAMPVETDLPPSL